MHATLREAVYTGLIDQLDGAYRFLHDRIQQAVYSLIPDELRVDTHLLIGRTLLAIRDRVQGVHVAAPGGRIDAALAVVNGIAASI